jgi:hypothetical protein
MQRSEFDHLINCENLCKFKKDSRNKVPGNDFTMGDSSHSAASSRQHVISISRNFQRCNRRLSAVYSDRDTIMAVAKFERELSSQSVIHGFTTNTPTDESSRLI